jgi:hypothetical protein
MDDSKVCPQFHLEEYKTLRAEIASDDADIRRLERLCAAGCAAVWVWLFGGIDDAWPGLAFVPVLIVFFGWLRATILYRGMLRIAEYIRHIEAQYACTPLVGWETFLNARRNESQLTTLTMFRSSHLFWCSLAVSSVVLGALHILVH